MTFDPNHLPDDPAELKRILVSLMESDAARQKAFDEMVAEMSRLNLRIEQLLEMIFGKKSEKRSKSKEEAKEEESATETPSTDAPETEVSAEKAETPEIPGSKPPRKKEKNGGGGRMRIPADLPVTVVEVHPPLEDRTCTECQAAFKWIGKSVSRRIIYVPPVFKVELTEIHAYAGDCDCSRCKIAKEEPDVKPIDKGLASTSLLAIMVIMRCLPAA